MRAVRDGIRRELVGIAASTAPKPCALIDEAEGAAPLNTGEIRPASDSPIVAQDIAGGRPTLRSVNDFGERRIREHRPTSGEIARQASTIDADEPLSAPLETRGTEAIGRNDWYWRIEIRTTLTADREVFFISPSMRLSKTASEFTNAIGSARCGAIRCRDHGAMRRLTDGRHCAKS